MKISAIGIKLIQGYEKCKLKAYQDSKGVWTIGWGNTFYENGQRVKEGDVITKVRADSLFALIITKFEQMVLSKVTRPLLQQEFDGAVCFAYNCGTSYKLKNGQWKDFEIWNNINKKIPADQMKDYWESSVIKSGGKVLNGLIRRRKSEALMYCTGELNFFE